MTYEERYKALCAEVDRLKKHYIALAKGWIEAREQEKRDSPGWKAYDRDVLKMGERIHALVFVQDEIKNLDGI